MPKYFGPDDSIESVKEIRALLEKAFENPKGMEGIIETIGGSAQGGDGVEKRDQNPRQPKRGIEPSN